MLLTEHERNEDDVPVRRAEWSDEQKLILFSSVVVND